MLQKLSIRNYALINSIDIEFDSQLNIITGETGAGKSIILGALSLILGQRAESKYFFNQENKCIIEGSFKISKDRLKPLFEALDVDAAELTLVRREISSDGRSRSFINDTPVNLSQLKWFGEQLIDIHSQHAILELNDERFQLQIVDSIAGNEVLRADFKSHYQKLQSDKKILAELLEKQAQALKERDLNQFLFTELEQAQLDIHEQKNLEQELEQLTHAEQIKSNLLDSCNLLSENEESALSAMKLAVNRLSTVQHFNEEIESLNVRLQSAVIELKDISSELNFIEQKVQFNPSRAEIIQERLDLIYTLQQKHRVQSIEELLEIQEGLSTALLTASASEEQIDVLKKSTLELDLRLQKMAMELSDSRAAVLELVKSEILGTLTKVGIPKAALEIENSKKAVADYQITGIDKINFLFTANAGQAPAPLNKIASGGELSRFMLAVKTLLSKNAALPTIIFDEIDTGISGETARLVGQVMEELSQQMQIITITHLPQIASRGNSHFYVYKQENQEQTFTGISKLSNAERVDKIAEMLSGKETTNSALDHARELLG